jgi:PadR family transcriptional regulator, regulatory protein PadR
MTARDLQLMQGTLELLILSALADGDARHGFAVLRWLSAATEGALSIEAAALYPALHRMERRGWLESEWGLSENNRKAKYYSLTHAGRKRLEQEGAGWRRYVEAVGKIMSQAPGVEAV